MHFFSFNLITRKFSRDADEVLPMHKPEADEDVKTQDYSLGITKILMVF